MLVQDFIKRKARQGVAKHHLGIITVPFSVLDDYSAAAATAKVFDRGNVWVVV